MAHHFTQLQAILFDMDGTLVDSSESVVRSWRAWAERRGLDPAVVLPVCHGRPARDTIRLLAPEADLPTEYDFVLQEELREGGVAAIAGAAELLRALTDSRARWAIVTSADERLALHRLRSAGLPCPEVLVTVDRIRRGKPDPEGFLLGAKLLGADPKHCLVLEDTPVGLQAGAAAGMQLLGVGRTVPAEALPCEVKAPDLRTLHWQNGTLSVG